MATPVSETLVQSRFATMKLQMALLERPSDELLEKISRLSPRQFAEQSTELKQRQTEWIVDEKGYLIKRTDGCLEVTIPYGKFVEGVEKTGRTAYKIVFDRENTHVQHVYLLVMNHAADYGQLNLRLLCNSVEYFPRLLEWGVVEDRMIMIDEYYPFTLEAFQKSFATYLSKEHIQELVGHVLKALYYLHQRRVVHCDVKKANILVKQLSNGKWHAALTDLGLYMNQGVVYKAIGTPIEMAPEMFPFWLEKKETNCFYPSLDLWSIGLVAYELLHKSDAPFKKFQELVGSNAKAVTMPLLKWRWEVALLDFEKQVENEEPHWLQGLLRLDPEERLSAKEALESLGEKLNFD